MSRLIAVGAISLACALVAACQGRATDPSPPVAEEHMPLPASLWLTSSPAAPAGPVLVELTDPQDPEFHRSHRFPAGVELRATFPVRRVRTG